MSSESPPKERWKVIAGYAGFAIASFIFFLYLTFPYEAVRARVTAEAAATGWTVKIGSLGPGFLGITARDVQLRPPPSPAPPAGDASLGQPGGPPKPLAQLTLESVSARPALFPPGIAVRTRALGGSISGSVGLLGDLKVRVSADGLDAADPAVKALSGVDASGLAIGNVALSIPREEGPAARVGPRGFDLSRATGTITLAINQALVKGGTATVPLYGQMTPIDLPRISLGQVDGRITFEQGKGKIESLRAKSEDLEIRGGGTINLGRRVDLSDLNVELKLKTDPEFTKRLGLLGSGLSVLPPDKADPSFRVATISGYLGSPRFVGFPR